MIHAAHDTWQVQIVTERYRESEANQENRIKNTTELRQNVDQIELVALVLLVDEALGKDVPANIQVRLVNSCILAAEVVVQLVEG